MKLTAKEIDAIATAVVAKLREPKNNIPLFDVCERYKVRPTVVWAMVREGRLRMAKDYRFSPSECELAFTEAGAVHERH